MGRAELPRSTGSGGSSGRAQGSHAYEVTVRDGDSPDIDEERCELTQGRTTACPGPPFPSESARWTR